MIEASAVITPIYVSALASAVGVITVGASGKPEKAPLPLKIRIYYEFLTYTRYCTITLIFCQ